MSKITCLDVFDNPVEVDVAELSWRPSAYGIVIKDGAVLLSPQHKKGYDFPGGGVDLGESLVDAVKREVDEETGLQVEVGELLTVRESYYYSRQHKRASQTHLFYYVCHNPEGQLSTKGFDEHEKGYAELAQWVPLEKVDGLTFYNGIDDSAELIKRAASL